MPERTYTTHDIARFCDVYPSSVMHWINVGKLRTHRTAGGHHRVTREDLVEFLLGLNIRLPEELVTRKRILVVDDDAELVKVVARAFARLSDFDVETCGDGINALIRIGQNPPDLVVLDIVIPKMDGMQVCRVLKSQPETRGIKIIAVTGQKLPFSEKKLVDIKVDAFFRKPLDLKALTDRAAELLRVEPAPRRSVRAER
ncbi:MAG: response regulator [Elusimicrobia bacterium]|nr:response regulator [Elusimicrobiota bacterium]